ncbi:hypothetical protein HMPREF3214_00618 [Alloscardovia omnicolens]|nr:hypothetical protein HMPREF3214_00618 [Alloscardovia omnicolens]
MTCPSSPRFTHERKLKSLLTVDVSIVSAPCSQPPRTYNP